MLDEQSAIKLAASWIKQADGLLITAGAGMGVDSGLPDFRGKEGLWKAYPALAKAGLEFDEIASAQSFMADPALAWGFYGHRLLRYREAIPHHGFAILRDIASHLQHGAFVFTSNVDGQFQKAGFLENQIYECHGSIHRLQCINPCIERTWPVAGFEPLVDLDNCRLVSSLPRCDVCGGVARPNILMFDDYAWIDARSIRQQIKLDAWLSSVTSAVVIEIGAGRSLPRVRYFSEARRLPLIRINPREPQVPGGKSVGLPMSALDALQLLKTELGSW